MRYRAGEVFVVDVFGDDDGYVIRPMFARAGDAIRPILDDAGDEPVESLAVRYVAPMMEQVGQ